MQEISITEMEYDYALSLGIPIARFVHANPSALPEREREPEPTQHVFQRFRDKLTAFPNLCVMWSTQQELIQRASPTLIKLSETCPRPGWIPQTHAGFPDGNRYFGCIYDPRGCGGENVPGYSKLLAELLDFLRSPTSAA